MKIGILTFHTSINNGAVMQAYSLSKRLASELPDCQVEIINYRMPKVDKNYQVSLRNYFNQGGIAVKIKLLIKLVLSPNQFKWQKERKKVFESVADILPLSDKMIYDDQTDELFKYINERYDIVIAGSDAIWNYVTRGFPNPYFLSDSITAAKLSYAASCYGMSYEKIPEEEREQIGKILDSYCFLGVRDRESELFAESVGCKLPTFHTCDPTAFLDANDLPIDEEKLMAKLVAKGFDPKRETIGMMGNENMCGMIRSMYGNKYQIVALYNYCKGADVNLYDLTPYEWAYVFRLFKVTFTTYFHGTLLSLRNGTPVVCIALDTEYSQNHMTKVEDVLLRVGLSDCYFKTNYAGLNYAQIKAKSDELISGDYKGIITEKMDREAESFLPFLEAIKNRIDK